MSQVVLTAASPEIFPCIPKYSKLELDLSNYLFNNDGCRADLHCISPHKLSIYLLNIF